MFLSFLKCCYSGLEVLPPFLHRFIPKRNSVYCFVLVAVSVALRNQSVNMVQRISNIIKEYQDILREKPYVLKTYFQRDSMGFSGDANELFLTLLFSDHVIGLQFF